MPPALLVEPAGDVFDSEALWQRLRDRDWAGRHPSAAGLGLVYAWNENDEGGWLVPTFPFDDSRIRALGEALGR